MGEGGQVPEAVTDFGNLLQPRGEFGNSLYLRVNRFIVKRSPYLICSDSGDERRPESAGSGFLQFEVYRFTFEIRIRDRSQIRSGVFEGVVGLDSHDVGDLVDGVCGLTGYGAGLIVVMI